MNAKDGVIEIAQWEHDCRTQLQMDHENEVFLKFVLLANILGYRYAAYGLEYPTSVAEPPFTFFANYAPDWHHKFVDRNPKHHGSRVAYGKRTVEPPDGSEGYNWSRIDFQREAQGNHINFEWFDTIQGPGGTVSLVGLAGRHTPDSTLLRRKTRMLIDLLIEGMNNLLLKKNMPQMFVELTEQERKYLQWVLDGKTSGEIADIMHIRKSAVENMQRSLPERFDRNGIFVTAFLAYRLGMLTPDSP